MFSSRQLSPFLAAFALAACSSPPPPPVVTPPPAVSTVAPVATASATVTAEPAPPVVDGVVRLYPVAKVYSLIDIVATEGTIEARLGYDPGGGMIGTYRYVPIVAGALDLTQETSEVTYVNTASDGSVRIAGKRPSLVRHAAAGFRSNAVDNYWTLDADNTWKVLSAGGGYGIGAGIYSWSEDRLLEWRVSFAGELGGANEFPYSLTELRVLRGANKAAPSIPPALKKRLKTDEGFWATDVTAFRTGEVLLVGYLTSAKEDKAKGEVGKIGTLLWKDKLQSPEYFTVPQKGVDAKGRAEEPRILGGDSLANVRLLDGNRVLKLDGSSWVEESTVPDKGLPDVWFGAPRVMMTDRGAFARVAKGAPWAPLAAVLPEKTQELNGDQSSRSFAVDAAGVIWVADDELLLSSKLPASQMVEITEDVIVARRKASVLGGGSLDATHEPPGSGVRPGCSLWYVLLDRMPIPEKDTTDYPEVRGLLKGHGEWSGVKLVVSREKGQQLFGAQTADEKLASKIAAAVGKKGKGGAGLKVCAEPVPVRQIKIDFATGDVTK